MNLKNSRARQCAGSTHLHTEQHLNLSSFTVYGTRNLSRDTRRGLFFIHKSFIYRRETARKYAKWLRNGSSRS